MVVRCSPGLLLLLVEVVSNLAQYLALQNDKSRKHLNYLHELQSKYVVVPADKAANNVIVVCKKCYLEVVLKELRTTNTYKHVDRECMDVVTEHLKFMTNYKIYIKTMTIGYQN